MDAKTLQISLESLGFILSLAKPQMERRLENGRPAHKMIKRVTHRRSRYASERRGIGEDERQPVMA